ncbi:MAG TPA: carbamoyltransferase C-terminal domain-containing protein [Candidatus Tectomicrobia bacterium]|nr:carbamoyltransferase C-terminal domain-containing protein [Candidatus Tectomicrobia bacterium]
MRVLGITDGITCGAAAVEDGRIVAAVNEERLIRKKMAFGFPFEAIREVVRLAGWTPRDVDRIACATRDNYFTEACHAWDGWFESRRTRSVRSTVFAAAAMLAPTAGRVRGVGRLYRQVRQPIFIHRRHRIAAILRERFGLTARPSFINHHYAHAASAYWTSGFEDALVVTLDGGGDGASSQVYDVRAGKFRRLNEVSSYDSLGNYYAYVTAVCGFKAQKHEGKITGLAAHGVPKYLEVLDELITYRDGQIVNAGRLLFNGALTGIRRRLPPDYRREDLAASIQVHAERLVSSYIRYWLQRTGARDVALAGGVFANVRINQRVHETEGVRRVFVHPAMDDSGLAVGAALLVTHGGPPGGDGPIPHVYLGSGYTGADIEAALAGTDLPRAYHANIEAEIARLLAAGHVVARFHGRMEYGPRALGNRSILYTPTDPSVNDWLNACLRRTEFMPFAPSTLAEYAGECYEGVAGAEVPARFMTITFQCTPWMRRHCPGVVHLDGTARPQLVRREDNPSYYAIIEEFRRLTGLPTIINTSFNIHEEPIVCSPADAIRAFTMGHLDYLAIGNVLVTNPRPRERRIVPTRPA